ncbi:beta strand repeat-containing protein [Candidatus Rhodoluna planktonica]|uniref:Fibronectin type-III domain-containing protein n=1 Tax=Candidatus Rhodoluna planktonica TaxID=535712 RepID=A0A1D9E0K3_9MICO|nr:hypothetical protein [Candidatus Rhodoluna planktonica]AOY56550.1 hypothetical protein A4Z71_06290 [Candidatus Rhodoluna planktonica]
MAGKHLTLKAKAFRFFMAATVAFSSSIVAAVAPIETEAANAATNGGTCLAAGASTPATPTDYVVQASHGKVFYIDTGQGQRIDASYAGYRVTRGSGNTSNADVWVKVDGFDSTEVVQLANQNDATYQLGSLNSGTKASYFLLKAPKPTTAKQSHVVRIYEGNPNAGGVEKYFCEFSFDKVKETIKAAANKVDSVTSISSSFIGGELVVTHKGLTGTIGAGSAPDLDVIWISPASSSSWPTRAYRLTKVSVTYYDNKAFSGTAVTKDNELILKPAINSISSNKTPGSYTATYTFKIIGQGSGAIAPVAQISSGTQIKHTDMGGYYNTDGSAKYTASSATLPISLTAAKSGTGVSVSGTNAEIGYRVVLTNSSSSPLVVDSVVDTASNNMSFKSLSASTGSGSTTAIADPGLSVGPAGFNNYTFSGPFTVPANGTLQINYKMVAACSAGTSTYTNSVQAKLGDLNIGSTAYQYDQVNTTMDQALASGSCSVSNVLQPAATKVSQPIEVITGSASSVNTTIDGNGNSKSTATLAGTVDPNGTANQLIQCEYSTDPNLAGSSLVSAATPAGGLTTASSDPVAVSCNLSDLQPGTTYYYRVKVGDNFGQILSFTTPMPTFDSPTAVTNSVSNLSKTSNTINATFNATVNARGNPSRVAFEYKLADSSGSAYTCTADVTPTQELFLDLNAADAKINLVLTGLYETSVSYSVTGLTSGKRYCYRVFANYDWTITGETTGTASVATPVTGAWVNFAATDVNPAEAITNPATSVQANSATLNGSVKAGTNNASVKFCYTTTKPTTGTLTNCLGAGAPQTATVGATVSAGITTANSLDISGLTAGATYYFQVIATDATTAEVIYANIESFTTPGPPLATTSAATNVLSTSATINGNVSANGASTTVYFCFSKTADFADANSDGYMDNCHDGSGFTAGKTDPTITAAIAAPESANRSANLTGLSANTEYKFQILASSTNGFAKGAILTFVTDPLPPVATTNDATNISYTSATLNGSVTTETYGATVTFCLSATGSVVSNTIGECLTGKVGAVTGGTMLANSSSTPSAGAAGLSTNTVYYFRVIVTPTTGSAVSGAVKTFTTLTQGPTPTTQAATQVSYTSAVLNGSVTSHTYSTTHTFCISQTFDVNANTLGSCLSGVQGSVINASQSANSNSNVAVSVTGLSDNTTYYFRVIATPSSGAVVEGNVLSFTTLTIIDPTPVTVAASSVSGTGATLNSSITSGTYSLNTISFCLSTTGDTVADTIGTCGSGTASAISAGSLNANASATPSQAITGLASNTTYYFRVKVITSTNQTFQGEVLSFTTPVILATASTTAASPVTANDAHLNGSTTTGTYGGTVSFCLSLTGNTASNTIGNCDQGTFAPVSNATPGAGASNNHTVEVSGLTPSTQYFFRIIINPATGSQVYGSVLTFTTNALGAPTAQTNPASNVGEESATLNSQIDGGATGATGTFCLSSTGNTAANTIGSCNVGTVGVVVNGNAGANSPASPEVLVTGLNPGTTYYFRVIATPTSGGSAVSGVVLSFTTDSPPSATTQSVSTLTDTTATLPGQVVSRTHAVTVTFCISTTGNTNSNTLGNCLTGVLGSVTNGSISPNSTQAVSVAASGLTPSTDYYYRVIATPTTGTTANGAVRTFKTAAAAVNNNGGNNGNNGGNNGNNNPVVQPTPTPSPTAASPTPTPSRPVVRPTPRPSVTANAPVALPTPENTTSPAPRVTPKPQQSAIPAPTATPDAPLVKNITGLLNQLSKIVENVVAPTSAPQRNNSAATPAPSQSPAAPANNAADKVTKVQIPETQTTVVTTEKADGTKDVLSAATRTVAAVAAEKISGFAPSAGIRIEVIGSRIAGQFVVTPGQAADPVAIAAAIEESTARQRTNFASIDKVVQTTPPASTQIFSTEIEQPEIELFAASGLAKPISLKDLNVADAAKWIKVDASADTYLPGTLVYLTVTTQPIIFGEAVVDKFGKAQLSGSLPIDLLEAGGHAIRLVGIRSLEGVSTDANGEIVLSEEAVNEIQKFDDGTQATVIISGASQSGGSQTVIREIPLEREVAWWTVWFALILGLLTLVARLIRRPVGNVRRTVLLVTAFASALPAAIIGWVSVTYEIWIGVAIAAAFGVVNLLMGRDKKGKAK